MRIFLMVIQVIVSLTLIGSVIMQPAKSQGLSSTLGGGAQMMAKQNRGFEGMMSKVTKASAVLFVVIAIVLVSIQ